MKSETPNIKHRITIKVSDTFERPLKGCIIAIYNYDKSRATSHSSDGRGQVSFELSDGSYDLEISKNGYRCYNRNIKVPPKRELNVTVLEHGQS